MIYPFSTCLYEDENAVVKRLLSRLDWPENMATKTEARAIELVEKTRSRKGKTGQLEAFLQEFSLNTEEGLAMMCLAEALLRIPDAKTANALIRDKVVAANWLQAQGGGSKDWMAKAAGVGMALTRKTLDSSLSKLGEPVIREAMVKAMQIMGKQFVLGTSIEDAISNAKPQERQGYRMSYDMLGEGARDQKTADQYFKAYSHAILTIAARNKAQPENLAGISVKLSALHPRYEYAQRERCVPEIVGKLRALCVQAAEHDIPMTVDAEEINRLDMSVAIIEAILDDPHFEGWNHFGMAVQAYQKRCLPLIEYMANTLRQKGRKMQIRLVKGAYWDTEIKNAQMQGLAEYGVFTRKPNTDVSYLACAQEMFKHAAVIYPMFASHNAHTIAAIQNMAEQAGVDFEFQRLHGMGESLYAQVIGDKHTKVSVYAPVGPHRDLLPYLVRRLLENGANSSFVNKLLDSKIPANDIVDDPVKTVRSHDTHRHPKIPLPANLFSERENSASFDLDDPASSEKIIKYVEGFKISSPPKSIIGGHEYDKVDNIDLNAVFDSAHKAFQHWNRTDVQERGAALERFADKMEDHTLELMGILCAEGGKTYSDARDEIREAVDFCRYYAAQARTHFSKEGILLHGYTGESDRLTLQGRGVFVCISPWNFPLAIFVGQIVAALAAGNAVLAKPASQTRFVSMRAVQLMHDSGIPKDVIHLLCGSGAFGGKMVANPRVAGVAFTGSTATAKQIQQTLATENPAIVPFIAETGGQNAMIVDSSALPEQVVDDVILSAFGSSGQRCSALRVLYIQNDIADNVLEILKGAMEEIKVGDPRFLSTDIGPVIDENARKGLNSHIEYLESCAKLLARAPMEKIDDDRAYFAPVAYEIPSIDVLKDEVFGPVLHIIRFESGDLDKVIEEINSTGFGLTFGLHSRIDDRQRDIARRVNAGNIYINRSTIGAVVGVQPFGGMGLSGTGPKAGGPHYLPAFGVEKVVSIDTTASGGNASLVSLEE
ncbi:MAG: bifunctional proline dehydrogenase/L-glutamate gamma-semialdehyde dehydrogenase PutA [Alphaproteobacteria bacterium]|nr:bifunctional proline dehydrogenase/L-glutamate gamma-semialdehyde dehydrogenase PutA [Alphaproteobacteria bacterium]